MWWCGGQEGQSAVGAGLADLSPVWPVGPAVALALGFPVADFVLVVAPQRHLQENSCLWILTC